MKNLVLVRHAKAERYADLGDKVRQLTDRGKRQAGSLGLILAEQVGPFDVAIVSGAARALQTYRILAGAAPEFPSPRISHELYEASARSILTMLHQLEESARRVMVVGHEPVISTLAHILHDSKDELASQLAFGIPTAVAVVLDVPGPWSTLERQQAHARALLRGEG